MIQRKTKKDNLYLLGSSPTRIPSSPDKARLEVFKNPSPKREYWINFESPGFTSLCPVTNQPDFGTITIDYIPDKKCTESKSLKLYLCSFRNYGTFHEAAVNHILDDFVKACSPRKVVVTGKFRPRDGISITVTAHYP